MADEFDVSIFFRGDVCDEVVERLHLVAAAKVEGVEGVVHECRHLAEFNAEQLLNR
jgi:hypothetical protein